MEPQLTLYQPLTHIRVMSSHKPIRMGGLILGVNTLYRLFCFFKLFPMVSKGLTDIPKLIITRLLPHTLRDAGNTLALAWLQSTYWMNGIHYWLRLRWVRNDILDPKVVTRRHLLEVHGPGSPNSSLSSPGCSCGGQSEEFLFQIGVIRLAYPISRLLSMHKPSYCVTVLPWIL